MRFLLTAFFLLSLQPAAQGKKNAPKQYATREIAAASDSILNSLLGSLADYALLDSGSYYTYTLKGKVAYSKLYRTRRIKIFTPKQTKKNFIDAKLIYRFEMSYPACKWYDTIKGSIEIGLDTALALENVPDLSFIPDMVTAHQKCNFIAADTAIRIALNDSIKLGVTHPYAFIKYRPKTKRFEWVVLSTIWDDRDFKNNKPAKNDMVVIDAITGQILTHKVTLFEQGMK